MPLFFEVIVKERPNLAIKILDKQRTFLYWENNARVFSYNTSLLGTIPYCSSAMKQMVLDERLDLISHIVVQYSLNLRWILFTREVLFFEFVVHVVFVLLLLGTTCSAERNIDLLVFAWGKKYSVFENPSEANLVKVGMVFLNLLLMFINIRYMYIQVVQSKISSILSGKVYSWWDAMHCRLRNEQFYLLPHLFILISQVLRCFPESEHLYVVADILVALVTWRLFYRGLSFGEGFESIGVPMCTIKQMIDVNRIYFLVLFVFITGFSHSMYLIFRDEPSSLEYGSFQMSWITLFFFVFNLDVGSLNEEAVSYRKYFGFLVIGVYMSIVCLVVFNLIIAVMTSTYESIQGNSKQQWLLQKARLIVFYESYENAINSILYKRSIESVRKGHLPPGDPKHYVKEQANGVVLVEVPRSYIRECLQFRLSTFQLFHRFRYSVFKRWKHLRRSPSFLWPETSGRSSSSAHRLLSHDSTSSSNPLEVLQLKSELLVVGKFQMLRRKKSSEKKVVSVSAGKRDKSMTGRKLSQAERDNEKMVSMLVKMQLSQERMHRELASLRTQVLELSLSGKANGG
uniref:Ion transport domain-containing protein n=1 Tax=Mucochytrium quahogii TaxID=96639 RepID=A0A7S2WRC7_9STRA|mmetsp:Transcript_7525/g.16392  ORF Transcript_7525/g.16392 Transcript_7525/m.16392 type:complete len:571 (+) Transcript_7525:1087-2799(+)